MNYHPFVINNRYAVDPALGIVSQPGTDNQARLEPRIMQLLCLLTESADELVTREYLIKEVWDNYGSADEGLTQSISYLRKILDDKERKLIETVPKKGYVLHGTITTEMIKENYHLTWKSKPRLLYGITLALLLLLAYFIFIFIHEERHSSSDVIINQPQLLKHDTLQKKSSDLK